MPPISLAIYLAALRVNPSSALKVLVLDDVLIGLDMSNRLPIIDAFHVELYRSFIMNPLSHAQLAIAPRQEIQDAIDTVERLEQALDAIVIV